MQADLLKTKLAPLIVRALTPGDYDALFLLHKNNTFYNACLGKGACEREGVLGGLILLPPGTDKIQKFYLGIFDAGGLSACLDYVEGYPAADTVFLGLLMVDMRLQGQGLGSRIISAFLAGAKESGYQKARLACLENNTAAYAFWLKQGFCEAGRASRQACGSGGEQGLILMENNF